MMSGLPNSRTNNFHFPDAIGTFPTAFAAAQSGNMQGLHGTHGNYNVSNASDTFPYRNSMLMGGPSGGLQQVAGTASNARFTSNGLPDGLSQVFLASQHGHSGVTNYGGSGALANIGKDGRMTNPVGSFVDGTSDGKGLHYGTLRNLTDAADASRLAAPQMASIMENSYSATGVPLSHNQYKASMLLNGMTTHEESDFDINDFPQLGGRDPVGVSQGHIGFLQTPNLGRPRNREFSIQNEEFPALPGYKGVDAEYRMNAHQKGHTQNSISSLMQSQHFPTQNQHAMSISGTSFPLANYQDPILHDPEARSMGQTVDVSATGHLRNMFPGVGLRDQPAQQYLHLQKQSYSRRAIPFSGDQDTKSMQAKHSSDDRYGLLGLLSFLNNTNSHLSILARGVDPTTLGLNLSSGDELYKSFASPWSDKPLKDEPNYSIPECYNAEDPPKLKTNDFQHLKLETLFYIFYSMPKDEAQLAAANALYKNGWFFHKIHRVWFKRVKSTEPLARTNTHERGSFVCFDPDAWKIVRKDNFVLKYELVEDRPILP